MEKKSDIVTIKKDNFNATLVNGALVITIDNYNGQGESFGAYFYESEVKIIEDVLAKLAQNTRLIKQLAADELTILCPYCNAPYTADMMTELSSTMEGCNSCATSTASATWEIRCSHCHRLVYKKDRNE